LNYEVSGIDLTYQKREEQSRRWREKSLYPWRWEELSFSNCCFQNRLQGLITFFNPQSIHFLQSQRLQSNDSELEDWEPKRIQRPEGVPEWGVPPTASTSSNKIRLEPRTQKSTQELEKEKSFEKSLASSSSGTGSKKVILGPDGKPCRACNSKLAFSKAMKVGGDAKGKGKEKENASANGTAAGASALATATTLSSSSSSSTIECPPDGEELGRSTWNFLHSTAAYYPDSPTQIQQTSILSLFKSLPRLYPCHSCAEALGQEYLNEVTNRGGYQKKDLTLEKAVKNGRFMRMWLCGIHNEVNERLGKQKFDCSDENLRRRWKDGGENGECE